MLLAACGAGSDTAEPQTFSTVVGDPEAHDGEMVTIHATYFGAFEQSVIASGVRESDPPQPVDPLIWVGAAPPSDCLQRSETASWAEGVEVSGTFRYDPEGGFGHLGEYEMVIENAELSCAQPLS